MLRLEMLPADYGDCLWLEYGPADDGRVVLIDGGPAGTYAGALRPRLEQFAASRPGRRPRIELLVVTHIDNDHIVGAIDLLSDRKRPVDIAEIWFNGWDQLAPLDKLGVDEGIELSTLIRDQELPHNQTFGGKAVRVNETAPGTPIVLPGGLRLTVLSPGVAELRRLRDEWKDAVTETAAEPAKDLLGATARPDVQSLADKRFKADDAVANGSSIVLLVEYANRRILLGADSFAPVVERSLSGLGYSSANRVALDAYKLSHHGSRANTSTKLLELVRCENYLFSTSGARFRHPHDECVARVLAYGGDRVAIYSNYRHGDAALWNNKWVQKQYGHRVFEPPAPYGSVTIEFA